MSGGPETRCRNATVADGRLGKRGGKNDGFFSVFSPKDTCISAVVCGNFRLKWACCVIESLNDLELGETCRAGQL